MPLLRFRPSLRRGAGSRELLLVAAVGLAAVPTGFGLGWDTSPLGLADPSPVAVQEPAPTPAADERVDPLARVAVVGASATAGFNLFAELGRNAGLADFLTLALTEPPGELLDAGDVTLFSSPKQKGRAAVERARDFGPTTTLAVDLPFWFIHGPHFTGANRRAAFEWLLETLDGDFGTLVLGTIPTMGDEVAEWMVPASLKAADADVAWANAQLAAWAAERDHVVIVPLAEFLANLRAGETLELRGQSFDSDETEEFLQDDGLHPTVIGTAALLTLMLDSLDRHLEGRLAGRVAWDVEALASAVEDLE